MNRSPIGQRIGGATGIKLLMDDLGEAISQPGPVRMLGGGNPPAIPELQATWRETMHRLLTENEGAAFDAMLLNYDTPKGRPAFIEALVDYFNQRTNWNLTTANIAITNGTQNALFHLFNCIAGGGKKVLLPLSPEYIGYADLGLTDDLFAAVPARLDLLGDHEFKYRIDFDALPAGPDARDFAAICVSRPTNPSGNLITDDELRQLSDFARANDQLLVIDNAYGLPFPGIVFDEADLFWDEHVVLSCSLSKLGLPGTRTGIVIANESVIDMMAAANAVANLATGNIGQELVAPLLTSGHIDTLVRDVVQPFYRERAAASRAVLTAALPDDRPWRLHRCEGSMFFWLWFPEAAADCRELYERLKQRHTIVVPGHPFFFGLAEPWAHADECLRIHFAMPPGPSHEGLEIIGEEIARAYTVT